MPLETTSGHGQRAFHSRCHIRRSANDVDRLFSPGAYLANAEAIRVRVLLGFDDFGNDDAVETIALDPNAINFQPQHRQLMPKCLRIEVRVDPFAQPRFYNLHRAYLNCLRKRRSFSKNVRRSVTP
jgi:hypothetical protein